MAFNSNSMILTHSLVEERKELPMISWHWLEQTINIRTNMFWTSSNGSSKLKMFTSVGFLDMKNIFLSGLKSQACKTQQISLATSNCLKFAKSCLDIIPLMGNWKKFSTIYILRISHLLIDLMLLMIQASWVRLTHCTFSSRSMKKMEDIMG